MTIQDAITYYKKNFAKCWNDEKYKWVAVKHFQEHWDIDAPDFAAMVSEAFRKADNLLGGYNYYAYAMLCNLAQQDPEKMRSLFQMLYTEELPLGERLNAFWDRCAEILAVFKENHPDPKKAKNHYQDLRALCVYLSFRYPEKYYLYKEKMYRDFMKQIGFQETSKETAGSLKKYDNFSRMCNDVLEAIKKDSDLLELQQKQLEMEPECFPDEALHLLTQTIIYVNKPQNEEIIPSDAKYKRWLAPIVDALYELGGSAPRTDAMEKVFSMCGITDEEIAESYKSGTSKVKNELDYAMLALYAEGIMCGHTRGLWELSDLGKRILISDDLAGRIVAKVNKISLAKKQGDVVPEIDLSPYYRYRDEKQKNDEDDWWPPIDVYNPGFSREQWLNVLNNPDIIGPVWGGALAAFYEAGGAATCKQIADRYHLTPSAIIGRCTQLAKRIHKETNCPVVSDGKGKSYFPILFQGKNADADTPGSYIWKLRPELFDALKEFDIMRYRWKEGEEPPAGDKQYWWLNANPKIWSFANIGVGEAEAYTLYNENGNKRRIFQNFLDAKAGDMVIGYESTPVKQIVAIGRISGEQDGEQLFFEKVEGLETPIDYATLRECPELEEMEYFQNPQGSLFKLTKEEYDFILDLIREDNPVAQQDTLPAYKKSDFLNEVFMTESRYERLAAVLRNKKNVILQGAPGVGKTFAARRLAWSMMGEKDNTRIEFIQFHQSYSYEDFIMGYKPVENGFELKYGIFYRFCQKAANQPDKEFFFIIDEINRGNMSKIFGELLMLIENDYRGERATLAYNGLPFSVPDNLYIIGMMNTADRSLAMIDYALRRRFSFFDMEPGFDSEGFIRYQNGLHSDTMNELVQKIKDLNREIANDKSLGKGFCIGHSYFCGQSQCTDEWLRSIVDYDILPMLSEYWFDDNNKYQKWESILQGVFQ